MNTGMQTSYHITPKLCNRSIVEFFEFLSFEKRLLFIYISLRLIPLHFFIYFWSSVFNDKEIGSIGTLHRPWKKHTDCIKTFLVWTWILPITIFINTLYFYKKIPQKGKFSILLLWLPWHKILLCNKNTKYIQVVA